MADVFHAFFGKAGFTVLYSLPSSLPNGPDRQSIDASQYGSARGSLHQSLRFGSLGLSYRSDIAEPEAATQRFTSTEHRDEGAQDPLSPSAEHENQRNAAFHRRSEFFYETIPDDLHSHAHPSVETYRIRLPLGDPSQWRRFLKTIVVPSARYIWSFITRLYT